MDARTRTRAIWTPRGLHHRAACFADRKSGDRDAPSVGNARHEGSGHGVEDCADPRQRSQENRCDFGATEITGGEDEHPGFAGSQRGDLQWTISQPLILGQHNPTALASRTEPDAVLLITREMVIVDLDCETGFHKFRSDWLYAQRPVDEEY